MRRITTLRIWHKLRREDMTWLHTRDLRLMRAVVKAADKHRDKLIAICNHGIGGPYAEVVRAIDAFNMPKGRK